MILVKKPIGQRRCQMCSNFMNWEWVYGNLIRCKDCGAVYSTADEK